MSSKCWYMRFLESSLAIEYNLFPEVWIPSIDLQLTPLPSLHGPNHCLSGFPIPRICIHGLMDANPFCVVENL